MTRIFKHDRKVLFVVPKPDRNPTRRNVPTIKGVSHPRNASVIKIKDKTPWPMRKAVPINVIRADMEFVCSGPVST
jgi:hypothetical protein